MGAVLLLWIGILSHQAIAIDHYPSMAECLSAALALQAHDGRLKAECLPYEIPK